MEPNGPVSEPLGPGHRGLVNIVIYSMQHQRNAASSLNSDCIHMEPNGPVRLENHWDRATVDSRGAAEVSLCVCVVCCACVNACRNWWCCTTKHSVHPSEPRHHIHCTSLCCFLASQLYKSSTPRKTPCFPRPRLHAGCCKSKHPSSSQRSACSSSTFTPCLPPSLE